MRRHLTYADSVGTLALFIALGGTGYAAIKITGKNVVNGSLTGVDVKNNSLTGVDVKDRSLKAADFDPRQLPRGATGATGGNGATGPAGPAGAKGDAGATGILGSSFVYQQGAITLPVDAPASQVNFLSSADPTISGGVITTTRTGQLHAEASTQLVRSPGAGGAAFCHLRMNGAAISHDLATTFSDAGLDAAANPALPSVTMTVVGSAPNLPPGTYNVGLQCEADRPGLVTMSRTDLHAVVYAK